MKKELTEEDIVLWDNYMDAVAQRRVVDALRMYMKASPKLKRQLPTKPSDLLIPTNPNIQDRKVMDYIKKHDEGDEVGMRRIYSSANAYTRRTIDHLFQKNSW